MFILSKKDITMRDWVFTTKPGHFNIAEALVPGETLDWPTFGRFKFEVGDRVFFYASSPVLQMIGKLEVEALNLDFSEIDPRNDLRKWPKHHSRIPWMRLRVLQVAPVPFKPLQRGSLYYHTEFKPSPYPKLLHEGEKEYVLRAFDEAMSFSADKIKYEGGLDPEALARVKCSDIELLRSAFSRLSGGNIDEINFDKDAKRVKMKLSAKDSVTEKLSLTFNAIKRVKWDYDSRDALVSGIRLTFEDTYLLTSVDGADLEILCEEIAVDV